MNYPLVIKVLGYTLWVEAGCMVLPLLVAVYYQEPCWESFLYAAGLCAAAASPAPVSRHGSGKCRDGTAISRRLWCGWCCACSGQRRINSAAPFPGIWTPCLRRRRG